MMTVGEGWTGGGVGPFSDGPTPHTAATCRGWGQGVEGSGDGGGAKGGPTVPGANEGTDAVEAGRGGTDCM